ncbi:hypothetical protein E2C01_014773 [Portunus trituberculatus]|uniref:Uncharacterized protein n=1 Tax=Portunus trituberculatus TaxID=210409 RepID=A0A5B7DKZ9_PORTR|nr:hypothetical protein [Portunus trituberculatus]
MQLEMKELQPLGSNCKSSGVEQRDLSGIHHNGCSPEHQPGELTSPLRHSNHSSNLLVNSLNSPDRARLNLPTLAMPGQRNHKHILENQCNFTYRQPCENSGVLLSNDMPPPLNSMSCANGNLLYVFIGGAQLGRQVHRHLCEQFSHGHQ